VLAAGDEVEILPAGTRTRVTAVDGTDGEVEQAFPPMSVTVQLEDGVALERGDMIVAADSPPVAATQLRATVCWMADEPLHEGRRLKLKHTTRTVPAELEEIEARVDVNTFAEGPAAELELNAIGRVRLALDEPVFVDPYDGNRITGSFILIDEATNDTVAAGMIDSAPAGR
jgi:bifunctional enzyme CysN/CysC